MPGCVAAPEALPCVVSADHLCGVVDEWCMLITCDTAIGLQLCVTPHVAVRRCLYVVAVCWVTLCLQQLPSSRLLHAGGKCRTLAMCEEGQLHQLDVLLDVWSSGPFFCSSHQWRQVPGSDSADGVGLYLWLSLALQAPIRHRMFSWTAAEIYLCVSLGRSLRLGG